MRRTASSLATAVAIALMALATAATHALVSRYRAARLEQIRLAPLESPVLKEIERQFGPEFAAGWSNAVQSNSFRAAVRRLHR